MSGQGDRSWDPERQANHWLTKRDAGLMTPDDDAALDAWLAEDPRHAIAFARAQAILEAIAHVPSRIDRRAARSDAREVRRPRRHHRRGWHARRLAGGGAVAASLALVATSGDRIAIRLRADAITAVGETRRVAMPDGSTALLDTGSAIAFRSDGQRGATLLAGQAAFEVAADPDRPFVVEARGGATTALGTRFIVSRIDPVTRVTVTQHAVRVSFDGEERIVPAGSSLSYGDHALAAPRRVAVRNADAWTRDTLRFVARPLREVVAELDRYHHGHFGVIGARIGNMPVSGVFSIRDPVAAIDTIERSLGLGSYRLGDRLILLHG